MKKLILFFWLAGHLHSYAQNTEDYIVTISSDTLYGQIVSEDWYKLSRKITFIKNDTEEFQYSPKDIKAFHTKGYDFQSVDHNKFSLFFMSSLPSTNFMLRLVDGQTKLFAFFPTLTFNTPEDGFDILGENIDADEIDYYVVFEDGSTVKASYENIFDRNTQVVFTDWPDLHNDLMDQYDHTIIKRMVEEYNDRIAGKVNFSQIRDQADSVDVYIFRDFEFEEDEPLDLKISLDGSKLPKITENEYIYLKLPSTSSHYINIKGKRFKADLEFFGRKKTPVLIEITSVYFDSPNENFIRVVSPEYALSKYLSNGREIKY